jgi:hypothetical protein
VIINENPSDVIINENPNDVINNENPDDNKCDNKTTQEENKMNF